jgi:hypothetical protein
MVDLWRTSEYVRLERVNKWPNCIKDIWWWWWWWNLISALHLRLCLLSDLFFQAFWLRFLHILLCLSLFYHLSAWSDSTNYDVPLYVISSMLLLLPLSWVYIVLTLFSKTSCFLHCARTIMFYFHTEQQVKLWLCVMSLVRSYLRCKIIYSDLSGMS